MNNTVEVTTDYATKNYNTTEASDTVIDADNFLSEFVKNTIIGKMGKTIFLLPLELFLGVPIIRSR